VARRAASRWRRPLRRALLALAALWLLATVLPVAALRVVRPLTTSFMVQRWFGHGAGGPCRSIDYDWVGWDAISAHAKLAVLASEDQRFAAHVGFDLKQEDDYTIVLFKHEGWREPVEFMSHCSTKWATFLMSLKQLVETGTGAPHPQDVRISNWH